MCLVVAFIVAFDVRIPYCSGCCLLQVDPSVMLCIPQCVLCVCVSSVINDLRVFRPHVQEVLQTLCYVNDMSLSACARCTELL